MAFSYDVSTDPGKVRLLIPDRVQASAVFSDEEIAGFLALESGVYRAAALALETIASDTAAVLRVTRMLGFLDVDGTRASAELLKRAATLRTQAEAAEARSGGLFDIAEWAVDTFSAREITASDLLRSGV